MKESPGRAGASKELLHESRDQGALDAPILSQRTNQARRGTKCNVPGWAGGQTGDFNGLTLSHSSPVIVGSRGFSLNRGRGGKGGHEHNENSLHLPPRHVAGETS